MGAAIKIEQWQIKKMWAISKALGMTRDDLHAMAGADSLTQLNKQEANEVIDRLEKMQGSIYKCHQKASSHKHEQIAGGATAEQQKKVWALMYELQKFDTVPSISTIGERLCGIIRKELYTDCIPKKPFTWIKFEHCDKLIEIIKKYVINAKKKAGVG